MIEKVDDKVPFELLHAQVWMGEIIAQPLAERDAIQTLSPSGKKIKEEASDWVLPNAYLHPWQRLEIYNQQYWWRLQKLLGQLLPTLLRYFGTKPFNEAIAIPYLSQYCPHSWYLREIGDKILNWIDTFYQESDKQLVKAFCEIDLSIEWAFRYSRIKSQNSSFQNVKLQPFVLLIEQPCDLLSFRRDLLKYESDHWHSHPFPKLMNDRIYYYMIYRNLNSEIITQEISKNEYEFLKIFKEHASLERACESIAENNVTLYEVATKELTNWFQHWASLGLLVFF